MTVRSQLRTIWTALFLLCAAVPVHAVTCSGTIPAVHPDGTYTDHADGTITHLPTGLMWKKCAEGLTGGDCGTGAATTHTWADALALGEGTNFAGHSDWRVPSINELYSLVETCRTSPTINNSVFPNTPVSSYWSSSPYAGDTSVAWAVVFSQGLVVAVTEADTANPRSGEFAVRLVRGGKSFSTFDSRLDYTPDALGDFTAVGNATASSLTPAADHKTLAGLTTVTGIKVEGAGTPEYCVADPGDCTTEDEWTAVPGVVGEGAQVRVRLTAGATGETRIATLTVGGQTAAYSVTVAADAVCGAADGVASILKPVSGLCTMGAPGEVTTTQGGHTWTCDGVGDGEAALCSAPGADATGAGGSGSATFELVSGDGCSVESAQLVVPTALPDGVNLPFGALGFALEGCDHGTTATVQVTYDAPVDGLVYWKYINGGWTTMPATLSGNTATFTIQDDGDFDTDTTTPGRIADPGGPGLQPSNSRGGITGVPTLSVWMSIVLALGLLLVACRRRAQ